MNYYRITGYSKKHDFSFILDSNGMFEKLWQFSAYLVSKEFDIIEASNEEQMLDINIDRVEEDSKCIFLRACQYGKPTYSTQSVNNEDYKAIQIADKLYIPTK